MTSRGCSKRSQLFAHPRLSLLLLSLLGLACGKTAQDGYGPTANTAGSDAGGRGSGEGVEARAGSAGTALGTGGNSSGTGGADGLSSVDLTSSPAPIHTRVQ